MQGDQYDIYQNASFHVLFWIATLCYGSALALLLYNSYWYLCKFKRYKSFYIASFYVFSFIILLSRFLSYLLLLFYIY